MTDNMKWYTIQNRVIKELGINSLPISNQKRREREQAYVERMTFLLEPIVDSDVDSGIDSESIDSGSSIDSHCASSA